MRGLRNVRLPTSVSGPCMGSVAQGCICNREVQTLSDEIELISKGDGVAITGEPSAMDIFLKSEGLPSKDLGLFPSARRARQNSGR